MRIVDDDESVRNMLYKVIRSAGLEAFTVSSGEEALEAVGKRPFDLMLLDVNLRGMDGFRVIEALRGRGIRGLSGARARASTK